MKRKKKKKRKLSLDIRVLPADVLLELQQRHSKGHVVLEVVLSVHAKLALVALILLNIQTNGSTAAACAGEADHKAAAVVELDIQTLVLGHAAVQVGVGKVARVGHLAAGHGAAHERVLVVDLLGQVGNQLVGSVAVHILVVVAREERAAVRLPELVLDRGNAGGLVGLLLGDTGDDVQPGDNGPDTVLLTDVIAASSETLLTADGDLLVIKEVAEELPAGGDLIALQTLGLGDQIYGPGGGHGPRQAIDTLLLEPGDKFGVVRNDGQAVTRGDEGVGTVDHVAVTVTIAGSTKVNAFLIYGLYQLMGVDQVGVRVAAVEVRAGDAVHGAVLGQTQLLDEDVHTIGTSHTVHTVKQHLEVLVGAEELLDQIKVKDLLQHLEVIGGGVNDLDLQGTIGLGANGGGVDIGNFGDLIGSE